MSRLAAVANLAALDALPESWVDDVAAIANYYAIAGADLASGTTLNITAAVHRVTGSTSISNISDSLGAITGQRVKLIFQATCTVLNATGNIKLVGGAGVHATFTTNETLELVYDATIGYWVESNRSPLHMSGMGGIIWSGAGVPAGYLVEDGSAVSRTTYAALLNNIGTQYGAGDGSTTFNLPDSRGRVDVGHAASGGHTDVSTIGNGDGVSLAFRRPKHRHTGHSHSIPVTTGSAGPGATGSLAQNGSNSTGSADGGSGNANDSLDAPAYLVRRKLIRI